MNLRIRCFAVVVFAVEGKLLENAAAFDSLVGALIYIKVNKGNL